MEEETEIDATAVSGRNCVQAVSQDVTDEAVDDNQQTEVKEPGREQVKRTPRILSCIPDPPNDWKLNNLLDDIAMQTTPCQLDRYKDLFRGEGPGTIGKGLLEKCTTCSKFFQILRQREYISRDNLLYIQRFLNMDIEGNRELIEKVIEYNRSEGNLYFYEVEEQPEPGYSIVRFHLVGRDLSQCEPAQQQDVRNKVAAILCIPHDQIRIVGVVPASSLCITLLIPEIYVIIFQDMLERKTQFKQLFDIGVDNIYIDKRVYNISGIEDVEISETEQQKKIMHIYDQYHEQNKQLEKRESRMLDMEKIIDETEKAFTSERQKLMETESKLMKLEIALDTFTAMQKDTDSFQEDEAIFHKELSAINIPDNLREPIKRLLEANTRIVKNQSKMARDIEIKKLNVDLDELKGKVLDLERQLDIHRYLSNRSASEVHLLQTVRTCLKELQLEHFEKYVDIIKTLSTDLMYKERIAIQSSYKSEEHKEITKHMEQSQNLFLIGIICMEYSRATSPVDIENFITGLFKKVRRSDLAKKFEEKIIEVKHKENSRALQLFGPTATAEQTIFGRIGPMLYPGPTVEQTFFGRIGPMLNPGLLNTKFFPIPQGHVAVSTRKTFDMIFRPFRSFVLQTLHYFSY